MNGIFIFVLDRGFVVVGRAELSTELVFTWHLTPGRTVRRWGTTRGLAELVNGPTANTVLDDPAERFIPFRSVIEIIKVEEEKWLPLLEASSSRPAPATRQAR